MEFLDYVLARKSVGSTAGGSSGGAVGLNIAYGDTAPTDTTKLWVKSTEPIAVKVSASLNLGSVSIEKIGNLEQSTSEAGCAAVGSKVYVFGGSPKYNSFFDTIQVYDTATKTLESLSVTLPYAYKGLATATVGAKIYLFAGERSGYTYDNKIHIFDTETNTIQTLSATVPAVSFSGAGIAAVGTDIYLFGGSGNAYYNHIFKFDTDTNTITRLSAQLPVAVSRPTAVAFEKTVYIFGGTNGSYQNTIFALDAETDTISTLNVTLPIATSCMSGALFGSKIYLFGGTNTNTINVFDTETQTIETLELTVSNEPAYCNFAIATVGNRAYIIGGYENGNYITTIREFSAIAELESEVMAVIYSTGKPNANIVNSDKLNIEANVKSVYIGDADGVAQFVEAFTHKDGTWTAI